MTWQNIDGYSMEWTTAFDRDAKPQPCVLDAPIPINVSISPCLPRHGVVIEYRVNDGPIHSVPALPFPADPSSTTRRFQAVLPANQFGRVEYIPTLLLNGVAISPRLRQNPDRKSTRLNSSHSSVSRMPSSA